MNDIQQLEKLIKEKFPDAQTKIEEPLQSDGFWSLDIVLNGKSYPVDWSSKQQGFGLCTCIDNEEHGFCGPDIICKNTESTMQKITELMN